MLTKSLPETQELHEMVINTLSEGIYMVDRDRNILVWNDAAEKITGYSQEEMLSKNYSSNLLDHIDHAGAPVCNDCCPISATLQDGQKRVMELFLKHKRGYRVPIVLNTAPVLILGDVVGAVVTFTDISIRVSEENLVNSLTKLSTTDRLTGLPNKHQTSSMLESMMEEYQGTGNFLSVMYINLDDFSLCNDRFGYDTGNKLLIALADAFRDNSSDSDIIGRWNGEEFVGVFETRSQEHMKLQAEKLRAIIDTTWIEYNGELVHTTASIGVTMVTGNDTPNHVIDRAASLMHVSKISGKNCATIG